MLCMICKSEVNDSVSTCPNCGANPWRIPETFLNADQHQTWLNEVYNAQYQRWIEHQEQLSQDSKAAESALKPSGETPIESQTHADIKSLNMRWLKDRARSGDTEAQYELAYRYYYGKRGPKVDKTKAYEWFLRVANNEQSIWQDSACYMVADCLFYGIGIDKNEEQSALYYQQLFNRKVMESRYFNAGDDNNVPTIDLIDIDEKIGSGEDAIYMYAYCLYHAIGVERNYRLSFQLFDGLTQLKTTRIYPSGMRYIYENLFFLAECYYYGRGTETNYEIAFQLYTRYIDLCLGNVDWKSGETDLQSRRKRIKSNHPEPASSCYPVYFESGIRPIYDESAFGDFYIKPHEMLGNCYYQLAECYFEGHGIDVNYRIALRLYQEAQHLGYPVDKKKMRQAFIKSIFKYN